MKSDMAVQQEERAGVDHDVTTAGVGEGNVWYHRKAFIFCTLACLCAFQLGPISLNFKLICQVLILDQSQSSKQCLDS
jgi:hypothetical protein